MEPLDFFNSLGGPAHFPSRWFPVAGKALSDIDLHHENIIVSVIRGGMAVIPRGDVNLAQGDRLISCPKPAYPPASRQAGEAAASKGWARRRIDYGVQVVLNTGGVSFRRSRMLMAPSAFKSLRME